MGIFSFLFVFMQLLLFLPIGVLGPPTKSADAQPKITPTEEQMLFFIENLNAFLSEKCIYTKVNLSIAEIPFWPIELLEKIEECIGKLKVVDLVHFFDEKIEQNEKEEEYKKEEQSSSTKIVEMNVKQFWKTLLQNLLEKVNKNLGSLKSLSDVEQLLIKRELFIIGELFEKKVEKEFRENEVLQKYLITEKKTGHFYRVFEAYQVPKTILEGIMEKYRSHLAIYLFDLSKSNYIYRTEIRWGFTAAVFLLERKLQNDYKISNFSSFDLKQYFRIPKKFPKHDAITEISLSMEQMSIFIEKLYNFISKKCNDFTKSLFDTEKGQSWKNGVEEKIQECISKMKIGELAKDFKEKKQQTEQNLKKFADGKKEIKSNEVNANEFLDKILKKMLEKLPEKENTSAKQGLDKLSDEQQLLILRELFFIATHLEKKLEEFWRDEKLNGDGSDVINFSYRKEIQWKFWQAKHLTEDLIEAKSDNSWVDFKEHFVVHFIPRKLSNTERFRIDFELSLGQIALFVQNMDTFLQSKCGNIEISQIENIEKNNTLGQCTSQLKISQIGAFFKNKSTKVKDLLENLKKKIVGHLLKEEETRKQLSDEENLIVLLKLFKLSNFLNKELYHKLNALHKRFPSLKMYDANFYQTNMEKCAAVEYVIQRKLEKDLKKNLNAVYYAYGEVHIKINCLTNIYGIKLNVVIATLSVCKIVQVIGQFFNEKCEKNMWNFVGNEKTLEDCVGKFQFADLCNKFYDDEFITKSKAYYFTNLIGSILKAEASENEAEKQKVLHDQSSVYFEIDNAGLEMKLSVFKGLLKFGRLFMEKIGIFARENTDLDKYRTMTWNNIPITMLGEEINERIKPKKVYVTDELNMIKEAITKAGLLEAMEKELLENSGQLLKAVGVPEEKNPRASDQNEESMKSNAGD